MLLVIGGLGRILSLSLSVSRSPPLGLFFLSSNDSITFSRDTKLPSIFLLIITSINSHKFPQLLTGALIPVQKTSNKKYSSNAAYCWNTQYPASNSAATGLENWESRVWVSQTNLQNLWSLSTDHLTPIYIPGLMLTPPTNPLTHSCS